MPIREITIHRPRCPPALQFLTIQYLAEKIYSVFDVGQTEESGSEYELEDSEDETGDTEEVEEFEGYEDSCRERVEEDILLKRIPLLPARIRRDLLEKVQEKDYYISSSGPLWTLLYSPNFVKIHVLIDGGRTGALEVLAAKEHSATEALFDASYCKYIDECGIELMKKIVGKLPNVRKLVLCSCSNDDIMEVVGSCCHLLEDLDIHCSHVTDKGIMNLCGIDDENVGRNACCKILKSVDIRKTAVSVKGVIILLQTAKQIEHLHSEHTVEALSDFADHQMETYAFKSLCLEDVFVNTMKKLVHQCPHLEELTLCRVQYHDQLYYLSTLKLLKILDATEVKFQVLLPVLREIGSQLTCLTFGHPHILKDNVNIDINVLCEVCQNLEELKVYNDSLVQGEHVYNDSKNHFVAGDKLSAFQAETNEKQQHFHRLKKVSLFCVTTDIEWIGTMCYNMEELSLTHSFLSASDVLGKWPPLKKLRELAFVCNKCTSESVVHKLLVHAKSVKQVVLDDVDLTDAFITQLLSENPLSMLEELRLVISRSQSLQILSPDGIYSLLSACEKLGMLKIKRMNITRLETELMRQRVEKDYELQLDYH